MKKIIVLLSLTVGLFANTLGLELGTYDKGFVGAYFEKDITNDVSLRLGGSIERDKQVSKDFPVTKTRSCKPIVCPEPVVKAPTVKPVAIPQAKVKETYISTESKRVDENIYRLYVDLVVEAYKYKNTDVSFLTGIQYATVEGLDDDFSPQLGLESSHYFSNGTRVSIGYKAIAYDFDTDRIDSKVYIGFGLAL